MIEIHQSSAGSMLKALAVFWLCLGLSASAATYYWNTTTTGTWNNGSNWSNNAVTGGTTGVAPASTDLVVFNQSSINGNEIVNLSGATAIAGITFSNTGNTSLLNTSGSNMALSIGAGGIILNSGAGAVVFGTATNTQRITPTLTASQTWTNNSANTLSIPFATAMGANTLTLDGSGNFTFPTGQLSGAGSGGVSIIKNGSGTATLNTTTTVNSYTGGLVLNNGTFAVTNWANGGLGTAGGGLGGSSSAASNLVFGGGTLKHDAANVASTDRLFTIGNASGLSATIDSSSASSINSLSFTNAGAIAFGGSGSRSLTLTGGNTGSNIFAPILGDGAGGVTSLNKTGTGTWQLAAVNTYSGTTTVSGGSLQVGNGGVGKSGTGTVTVQTGSVILGTGVVQGSSLTAQSGASVHAGDSTAQGSYGTLTFTPVSGSGSFDFQSGSSVILGINTGGTSDLLNFIGTGSNELLFNGNLTVGPASLTPTAEQMFNLLDWSGLTAAPTFASRYNASSYGGYLLGNGDDNLGFDLPDISSSGFGWDISNFTTSGNIAIVLLVPEPSRVLLLMLGSASLLLSRSRLRATPLSA